MEIAHGQAIDGQSPSLKAVLALVTASILTYAQPRAGNCVTLPYLTLILNVNTLILNLNLNFPRGNDGN